jgi:DNA-binding transcriptional regulator/RsmH inhibitor MraZ
MNCGLFGPCVECYVPVEWEHFEAQIEDWTQSDASTHKDWQRFRTVVLASAEWVRVWSRGRVAIPPLLMSHTSIQVDVIAVVKRLESGHVHLQLWSPNHFNEPAGRGPEGVPASGTSST